MSTLKTNRIVLIVGSAPDAPRCAYWPKSAFFSIVVINNAWRIRDDWDYLIAPDDFPAERRPKSMRAGQRFIGSEDYVPANNHFGGIFYAGGTMAFTAGYWALYALRPSVLAFHGCDMIYATSGKTHFYGNGEMDPLRRDLSLRSLEAKSARLLLHAAKLGCACVRLSTGKSRLVFPSVQPGHLGDFASKPPAKPGTLFDKAVSEEARFGFRCETGRYWEVYERFCPEKVDALDALWLQAGRATTQGYLFSN